MSLAIALAVGPLVVKKINRAWLHQYVSAKVSPVFKNNRRIATSFQIKFEGEQYTLTNRHVCSGFDTKPFTMKPGDKLRIDKYHYEVIAVDEAHDLCLLEGNPDLPAFKLAWDYSVGDEIYIIGYPRGLPRTLRDGAIISEEKSIIPWLPHRESVPFFMVSSIGYPGNSGSPVINEYGNLVGVIFAGQRGIHTEMWAVPLKSIKRFLKRAVGIE